MFTIWGRGAPSVVRTGRWVSRCPAVRRPVRLKSQSTTSNERPDRPRVGVAVCTLRAPSGTVALADPEILLIQRAKAPGLGQWSFPGGSLELGETLLDCGAREVKEETGLKVDVWGAITAVDAIYHDSAGAGAPPQFHYVVVELLGFADGDPVAQDDAAAAMWLPRSQIPNLEPQVPHLLTVIDHAIALMAKGLAQPRGPGPGGAR
mmetsp:Transcript_103437/g.175088  ORF Transcript_103437/g.175088 Transcript_103437/m.175088 type:complete len:206 (+) Transcript_103437:104-721(+)